MRQKLVDKVVTLSIVVTVVTMVIPMTVETDVSRYSSNIGDGNESSYISDSTTS